MIYPLKCQKGFFTLQTAAVLIVFFGILFSFCFLSFTAQTKMQFRSSCTTETVDLQKKIIKAEKALFALNPLSTFLKFSYRTLQAARVAAIIALQPELVATLTTEIEEVQSAREALDKTQKGIVNAANLLIKVETARIALKMNQSSYQTTNRWTYFLSSLAWVYPDGFAKMAVEPDSDDVAPNYGLTKEYKLEQMVAFKWQLIFSTKEDAQRTIKNRGFLNMACGATANKDEKKWLVEIRKDKF